MYPGALPGSHSCAVLLRVSWVQDRIPGAYPPPSGPEIGPMDCHGEPRIVWAGGSVCPNGQLVDATSAPH